jgi:hypothetical protein
MSPRFRRLIGPAALAILGACSGRSGGNYGCGLISVTGQSLLLEEFGRPGATLAALPSNVPGTLPVRVALGPAYRAVVGRADSGLVVGVEGPLPAKPQVGFGILIVSPAGIAQGVLLYEGNPADGAPRLGTVNTGARNLPLIGLTIEVKNFEDKSCPIFPDSLRR